jgi:hypothetical protein
MINMINEAIANQKHLNLDVIPLEKMKTDKKVEKKKVVKKVVTFRGKEEAPAPKRNRGIRRRR